MEERARIGWRKGHGKVEGKGKFGGKGKERLEERAWKGEGKCEGKGEEIMNLL